MKFDADLYLDKNNEINKYTGLSRDGWIAVAKKLLSGAMQRVKSYDDPIVIPRSEFKITYPHAESEGTTLAWEKSAERFEALARTLFIAAPLLRECEELNINGLRVSEYYRRQILAAVTKSDPLYVGDYSYWQEQYGKSDPNRCYQQTVEGCALVTGLWVCKEQIWDRYSKEEKDRIAEFISSYAHAHTCPANWRLFNMLMLAFLYREGYKIDEELMVDHAQSIVSFYAGSGWYRDGHSFDYYSVWGFQFYAPIWNVWYGYERMPLVAKKFEEYSTRFMENFTDFFDEDGHMFLWGRSCIYRFACIGAFAGNMLLNEVSKDYGCLRRIASGCLLQFISRKDFWETGVPPLGFYGEFLPCVQRYSCAGSVYWLGKAFMLLYFSKDHPFWTSPEKDGVWNIMRAGEVKETVLDGPALAISDHQANGTAFLRTGKVLKNSKDEQGALLYGRLCFSTKYPVEASPSEDFQSQQYVLRDISAGNIFRHVNAIFWCGKKESVLYRRAFFDYSSVQSAHWTQAINLADFPVAYGIFRADKLRLYRRPVDITLGSFGFADNGTQIIRREKGNYKAIVLKGYDSQGKPKQMAMCIFNGWTDLEIVRSNGRNADSEKSLIIVAKTSRIKEYGYEEYLLCSQTLTKESHEEFKDEELFPLLSVSAEDERGFSAYGRTVLRFANGSEKIIDFEGIEGNLQI